MFRRLFGRSDNASPYGLLPTYTKLSVTFREDHTLAVWFDGPGKPSQVAEDVFGRQGGRWLYLEEMYIAAGFYAHILLSLEDNEEEQVRLLEAVDHAAINIKRGTPIHQNTLLDDPWIWGRGSKAELTARYEAQLMGNLQGHLFVQPSYTTMTDDYRFLAAMAMIGYCSTERAGILHETYWKFFAEWLLWMNEDIRLAWTMAAMHSNKPGPDTTWTITGTANGLAHARSKFNFAV